MDLMPGLLLSRPNCTSRSQLSRSRSAIARGFFFTPKAAVPNPETKPSEKPGENDS